MTKQIHAVIYSTPQCPQCKMTKQVMASNQLPYVDNYYGNKEQDNTLDVRSQNANKVAWSKQKIAKIKEKYKISQMPLVKIVDNDNKVYDTWSGFQPNKVKQWASVNKGRE